MGAVYLRSDWERINKEHISWLTTFENTLNMFLVSNIKCLCHGDLKRLEIRLKTFHVPYMNSKQTWSLAEGYCQFKVKFQTLMIKETLSATNFHFVAKIQRKSVLCSNEMLFNRPRTFDWIFVQTLNERLLEQITKFAKFCLHYFCTILYHDKKKKKTWKGKKLMQKPSSLQCWIQ